MGPMKRRKTEVWVGLFVLLSLGGMLFGTLFLAGEQRLFAEKVEVRAIFSDVQGLREGGPVLLAGLQCGTVKAIEFTPEGKLLVRMEVQKEYLPQIRKDSVATIGTIGLLGDKSVRISTGTRGEPSIHEGEYIKTSPTLTFEEMANKAAPIFDSLGRTLKNLQLLSSKLLDAQQALTSDLEGVDEILGRIRSGKGSLGRFLNDEEFHDQLLASIEDFDSLLKDLQGGKGTLGRVLKDPELYKETLSAVRDLKVTVKKTQVIAEKFRRMADAGGGTIEEIHGLVVSMRQTMRRLSVVAKHLESSSKELPMVFTDTRELLKDTRSAVLTLQELIKAIEGHWLIRPYLKQPQPVTVINEPR